MSPPASDKVVDIHVRVSGLWALELQRMFEHSNIIRLRFSRTNFFNERTFVVARWFIFGSKSAELRRSRASAECSSCNLALPRWRLSPDRSRRNGNMTFQLEQRMKDHPSKVSNTFLVAGIWNNQPVLHRALCALASSKQRQVTLVEVTCLVD